MLIDLTQLKPGQTAVVVEMLGGIGLIQRLQNMGIRPGKNIKKVSSHFWRGPQTVEVDKSQLALGFGMAKKIIVEVKR
jgi:ferrous iron transport protein A